MIMKLILQIVLLELLHSLTVYHTLPKLNSKYLKQIENLMEHRPREKTIWVHKPTYQPTQRAYFGYNLYRQPNNQEYLAAQYYRYHRLYNIGAYHKQLSLCIVAAGRNIDQMNRFQRFIDSIARQNYSNYIVYYTDDASTDSTMTTFTSYVNSLNKLKQKFHIVPHQIEQFALKNKDEAIRQFCPDLSIIIDVEATGSFIGNQAFKLINALFHQQDIWFLSSSRIQFNFNTKEPIIGNSNFIKPKCLRSNADRVENDWLFENFIAHKKQLYMSINQKDFVDENGQYYKKRLNLLILCPMIQMSGQKHLKQTPQVLYFHDSENAQFQNDASQKMKVPSLLPYLPLSSLVDIPKRQQTGILPKIIANQTEKIRSQLK